MMSPATQINFKISLEHFARIKPEFVWEILSDSYHKSSRMGNKKIFYNELFGKTWKLWAEKFGLTLGGN